LGVVTPPVSFTCFSVLVASTTWAQYMASAGKKALVRAERTNCTVWSSGVRISLIMW